MFACVPCGRRFDTAAQIFGHCGANHSRKFSKRRLSSVESATEQKTAKRSKVVREQDDESENNMAHHGEQNEKVQDASMLEEEEEQHQLQKKSSSKRSSMLSSSSSGKKPIPALYEKFRIFLNGGLDNITTDSSRRISKTGPSFIDANAVDNLPSTPPASSTTPPTKQKRQKQRDNGNHVHNSRSSKIAPSTSPVVRTPQAIAARAPMAKRTPSSVAANWSPVSTPPSSPSTPQSTTVANNVATVNETNALTTTSAGSRVRSTSKSPAAQHQHNLEPNTVSGFYFFYFLLPKLKNERKVARCTFSESRRVCLRFHCRA
jgi:hypothetical protein